MKPSRPLRMVLRRDVHPSAGAGDLAGAIADLLQLPGLVRSLQAEVRDLREGLAEMAARLPAAELATVAEAARVTGLSQVTIRRRIKAGDLQATRLGRSVRVDLRQLQPDPDPEQVAQIVEEALRR